MRLPCSIVLLTLTFSGCTRHQAMVRDAKLDGYFERYCDDMGSLGIGFVASHTYDLEFRQRLKTTQDTELRRLFVLQHLYSELDLDISDYERGLLRTGKALNRQMTAEERAGTRSDISGRLDDLSGFDPGDPQHEIAEFRERMKRADGGSR